MWSLLTNKSQWRYKRENTIKGVYSVRDLVVFQVISFAFFLFSSLVAQGLKLTINLLNSKETDEVCKVNINSDILRLGVVGAAGGWSSWAVCSFCCQWLKLFSSVSGCSLVVPHWRSIPCWRLWSWSLLLLVFIFSLCFTLSGSDWLSFYIY